MKLMIRVMFVVATIFSIVATTIIPHHHHNDGETICSCHHHVCCHESQDCVQHSECNDCSNCTCNNKLKIEPANLVTKSPVLQLATEVIVSECWPPTNIDIENFYREQGNYPPNLISKYIVYCKGIILRAPPQF